MISFPTNLLFPPKIPLIESKMLPDDDIDTQTEHGIVGINRMDPKEVHV